MVHLNQPDRNQHDIGMDFLATGGAFIAPTPTVSKLLITHCFYLRLEVFKMYPAVNGDSKGAKEIPVIFPALPFGNMRRKLIGAECHRTRGLWLAS
ncbi:hypothetical protein CISG_10417 [Coccidioides immitis RMSCC 3703]|uniref:Uncharacterized protein n=1 Tax=Coccidioides immitis RMSCC 3703 TaxID=454286 RepID=A0A0J8TQI5_COCIT|nr:hypothetical protein CISG_10417 [Coccidioides immitis RMSCC 3703]